MPEFTAVVHAADGVLFVAAAHTHDALMGDVVAWVVPRVADRLWLADAARVRGLIAENRLAEAVALCFARVGSRWDVEWLTVTPSRPGCPAA